MDYNVHIDAMTPAGLWVYRLPLDWDYENLPEDVNRAVDLVRTDRGFPEEYDPAYEIAIRNLGPFRGQEPYTVVDWADGVPE